MVRSTFVRVERKRHERLGVRGRMEGMAGHGEWRKAKWEPRPTGHLNRRASAWTRRWRASHCVFAPWQCHLCSEPSEACTGSHPSAITNVLVGVATTSRWV
ncbi:hypothetical protein CC85DRAFT_86884 [Cutaneotrichosporon oleaginosum]|uniref:Uncharacterized protein n=1 Tax=Cutaneotrichosporon oleaginosum TaxID=879819 RepID=A0A0J0XXS9_9TREE|nr:uncharacterized protein CC85DRAFT_86884 [Cutaneotrichosporon oleaginosum]KLT45848.1 hypothetical protein CC85DRAFT_86884 [Cutaneotrichosporon oleaginosum]TXT06551.1 hypothetical protein COLE_05882 [Cutaneotrichosporon oleaginosum]